MTARLSKLLIALIILLVVSPLLVVHLAYAQTATEPAPPDVGAHEARARSARPIATTPKASARDIAECR